MIKTLDTKDKEIATLIVELQKASYQIEADLIGFNGIRRHSARNTITQIIQDIDNFMLNWSKTNFIECSYKIIQLPKEGCQIKENLESATIIMAPMNAFNDLDEAFVCLFKQYLYYHEEWEVGYGREVEQDDWEKLLFETWIPTYLQPVAFQELSSDLFLLRFMAEITGLGLSIGESQTIIEQCNGLKVIELRRGVLDYDVFAYNNNIGMIYSWGINRE
ncbi:MAG: hypothetical protein H7X94_08415 [Vallitaleaceae bacterium]|nr:hypothetical protein [Vallitaleaceae bacterium]